MCSAGLTCSQNVDENMRWRCRRPALVAVETPELQAADEAPLRRCWFERAMHAADEATPLRYGGASRAPCMRSQRGPARSPWSRRQVLRGRHGEAAPGRRLARPAATPTSSIGGGCIYEIREPERASQPRRRFLRLVVVLGERASITYTSICTWTKVLRFF
jgi:hypothetical protein